jgi:diguanylate cyclase (GGDEF)-like protein
MTDTPDAAKGQGKKQRKPRKQTRQITEAAANTLARLSHQTELVRAELATLQQNLADVQRSSTSDWASGLREANEHLILAALHAETTAENAVTHLDELAHSSKHDALTGTPNRALMLDRLENAIAFAKRHGTSIGVLFLDLDDFKQINDTLGHAVGDAVLQSVARRLEAEVRQSDTVSRHGGDEFLVLLSEITQPSDAAMVAEKILVALSAPSRVDDHLLRVSASVGIALFPNDGIDAATLMRNADTAMYACKRDGGSNFQFYGDPIARDRNVPSRARQHGGESLIVEQATPRKILREANKQLVLATLAAQKLEEQTRQKYQCHVDFIALVAHGLRTALMPIKTATGLLDRARTQPLVADVHDILQRQMAHLSRLVEDLLAGGRGSFQVVIGTVDIVEVLTRAIEASRPVLGARHQQLTTHLPPGPLIIQADAMRLVQVLCNLLDNASKYTSVGGEISMASELTDDAVIITVSDNGIGCPPARVERIHRDLVEAHGGTIVARSRRENLGREFSVELPIRGPG